ncbi:PEP-CTERM sorting domain-containing protein [bacterium]|nr:PEP-CTERM sorting domain-containing protein [bacterium]
MHHAGRGLGTGRRAMVLVAALLLGVACARPAQATVHTWTYAGTGSNWYWFDTPVYWDPDGTPGAGDVAVLHETTGCIKHIRFGADVTNQQLIVRGSGWGFEFDLDGHTYTLTSTSSSDASVMAGGVTSTGLSLGNGTLTGHYGRIGGDYNGSIYVRSDASWLNSHDLYVGTHGSLGVAGTVSNVDGRVREGGSVYVGGAAAQWENTGELSIGDGVLYVENGGTVSSGDAVIGQGWGSLGKVSVYGSGSTWTTGELTVGVENGTGELEILGGGDVSSTDANIGMSWGGGSAGTGTVTVSGAGSTWTLSGDLLVALDGGSGTLNVGAGGTVSTTVALVGWQGVGAVTVDGAGATWTNSGLVKIYGNGTVTIQNGGEVQVGTTLAMYGTLNLHGGLLETPVLEVDYGGAVNWAGGTLRVTGPAGFAIGPGGPLGPVVSLSGTQALEVTNHLSVAAGCALIAAPGAMLSVGSMTNEGSLVLFDTTVDGTVYTPTGSTVTVLGSVVFNDLVSGGGGFYGPGTTTFAGGYNPGDSPALVPFEGSIGFGAESTLLIEIDGITQGTEYDSLAVQGDAVLGGFLAVDMDLAFRGLAQSTDEFVFLSAGGVLSGQFLNAPSGATLFSVDGSAQFTIYYGDGVVVLTNFAAAPEPTSLALLGLGALGLWRRRRHLHVRGGPEWNHR